MTTHPTANSQDLPSNAPTSITTVVSRLAQALDKRLSPGDLAELRRISPSDPGCPAFWRILGQEVEPAGLLPKGEARRLEAERHWATILASMALMVGLHQIGRKPGEALAQAGFSELRLTRFLRARGEGLEDALLGIARFLASKGESVDWAPLAELIRYQDQTHGELIRRAIARDYYATLSKNSDSNN